MLQMYRRCSCLFWKLNPAPMCILLFFHFAMIYKFYYSHFYKQRFQLPPSTSKWKRKLFYMLRDKLKFPGEARIVVFISFIVNIKLSSCSSSPVPLPFHVFVDMLLMIIFSVTPKVWVIIMTWFILASIARRYDVAPLFVSAAIWSIICCDMYGRSICVMIQ